MTLTLFIFLCFTVLIPFISFKLKSAKFNSSYSQIKIIGHRGAAALAPENTLSSFKKALDIGVDIIELDVHVSKDDSIIVMHDYNVSRTTNGDGEIENLSYKYIKSLDAGSWFNESFKNEKVPTLNEVLDLVNGKAKVLVELKWPKKGIYKNLVTAVVNEIHKHHAESWVILQSFETEYLQEINNNFPEIQNQQLLFGKSSILPVYFERNFRLGKFNPEKNITSLNIFYMYLNDGLIEQMHNENISVYAFTIDKEADMLKAANFKVDGIITNSPDVAVKLFRHP